MMGGQASHEREGGSKNHKFVPASFAIKTVAINTSLYFGPWLLLLSKFVLKKVTWNTFGLMLLMARQPWLVGYSRLSLDNSFFTKTSSSWITGTLDQQLHFKGERMHQRPHRKPVQ